MRELPEPDDFGYHDGGTWVQQFAYTKELVLSIQKQAYEDGLRDAPEGYMLVPIEPTTEMLSALSGEWHSSRHRPDRYAAMLTASQKEPQ